MKVLTITIRLPVYLKAKIKRLAHLNGITPSEMVRYAIQSKLPGCEAGKLPVNDADDQKVR